MKVSINGIRLFFDCEGPSYATKGPALERRTPLLILHGGPGIDHSPYRSLGQRLSPYFQVIYLDQRGSGRSDSGSPEDWNLDTWARDVFDVCEALELEKPIVLGHSFGGYVAQAYASRYPEQASRIILAGTAPRFVKERSLAVFERLGGARVAQVARQFFANPLAHFPDYLAECYPYYSVQPVVPEVMARILIKADVADSFVGGAMQTFDLRSDLAKIRQPVLVLSAERDVIATPADIEDLKMGLTSAAVAHEHFTGCGHEIFRDAEEGAVAAILRFCLPQ